MVNQIPISARIHANTMWEMDQEKQVSGKGRNTILNEGARLWLSMMDARRQFRAHQDRAVKRKIVSGFLRVWFPEVFDDGIL